MMDPTLENITKQVCLAITLKPSVQAILSEVFAVFLNTFPQMLE
jgi:hypothetical protein